MSALQAAVIARDAVRVTGDDSASFLQGQLSQDVEHLAVGDSTWSFVLQPQGKVDAWVGVARLSDDEFVLDVDAGFGPALLARLERFKLRVKVEQTLVEDVHALALRGDGATDVTVDAARHFVRRVVWPDVDGLDVIALGPLDKSAVHQPTTEMSDTELEAMRVAHGGPAMGREITDKTIPAELGQWVVDSSVSFTKGCFTGQELVARIDSRGGNVPRHLRVIELEAGNDVPVGAELTVDGASAGSLTSVAGSHALAFVPRSVDVPADATVAWDGGTASARILSS